MSTPPEPGLYRTTKPYPGQEAGFPAGILVYVGVEDGVSFVGGPGQNRRKCWFWGKLPLAYAFLREKISKIAFRPHYHEIVAIDASGAVSCWALPNVGPKS